MVYVVKTKYMLSSTIAIREAGSLLKTELSALLQEASVQIKEKRHANVC